MSKAQWRPRPEKQAQVLIATAQAQGYIVSAIDVAADGAVHLRLRRPGEPDAPIDQPAEDLRALI